MRKQDHLNALISNLTRNEKRYFKLYASRHTGNKIFTSLFDELSKCDSYEPEALSKKLKIPKPLLGHAKSYLEQVLLCSLRLYEQDKNLVLWLNNRWQEAQILLRRNQFELAFSINEDGLQKALAYDNFMMAFNFFGLKYNLLIFLNGHVENASVWQQRMDQIERLNETEQLMAINIRFSRMAAGLEYIYSQGKIEHLKLFKINPEKLKSNSARILWHEMKQYYYYYVTFDLEASIHHNLCKLKFFEIQPQLIQTLPNSYLMSLSYLSSHYGQLGKYEDALKFARQLELETAKPRKDIPAHYTNRSNLTARISQVYLLCLKEEYQNSIKKMAEVEDEMERLQPAHALLTRHYHALALFYTGRYDEARKICEDLQGFDPEVKNEIQFSERVLLVMIHYEMKNFVLLPYLLNSAVGWAKRHEIKKDDAVELLRLFRKLVKLEPLKKQGLFFNELKSIIEKDTLGEYTILLGLKRWVKNNE